MKANIHRGRTNTKGQVFSAKHNDRDFSLENAEHIDPILVQKNIVWKFDTSVDEYNLKTLDNYEQAFYEKNFSTTLDKRNEKQIANRHKDRVWNMEQFRTSQQYCPEEDIFNIGKHGDTVDPQIVKECFEEYLEWHKTHFPNVIFLDAALHLDEPNAAPHIQSRQLYVIKRTDEDGQTYFDISQKDALAAMGIERPDPTKKAGKHNNAKMTYTAMAREKWLDIAESHGLDIDREPQDKSLSGLTLLQLKVRTAEEKIEAAEKNLEQLSAQTETKITQTVADFVSGKGAKKIAAAEKIIDNSELVNETLCKENNLNKARIAEQQKLIEAVKRDLNKAAQTMQHRDEEQARMAAKIGAAQRELSKKSKALGEREKALENEKKSFARAVMIQARQLAEKIIRSLGIKTNKGYDINNQINLNLQQERGITNDYDHNH